MRMEIKESILYHTVKGAMSTGHVEGVVHFKDDRWLLKCQSEGDEKMFAVVVPESDMENYDRGGVDSIGLNFEQLDKALEKSDNITIFETYQTDAGTNKFRLTKENNFSLEDGLVNQEFISGKNATPPKIDWIGEFEGDMSFLKDFVKKVNNIVDSSSYMIGLRQSAMYLYAEKDDANIHDIYHLEDFDSCSMDWDNGLYNETGHNPPEDKAMDAIMPVEWCKSIHFISDEGTLMLNNHAPMKLVFETEGDWMASYFISPRIPGSSTGTRETIPSEIVQKRGLESS